MSELRLITMVLPVLVPVLIGWLFVRSRLAEQHDAKALTAAFLYIFLPALIIRDLARQNLAALFNLRFILATLALMCAIYAGVIAVNLFVLRRPLATGALSAFACAKFNAMVVGLPVLIVAIGDSAIIAVVINLIIGYFTILPVTLVLLEVERAREAGHDTGYTAVFLSASRHIAQAPLVIATVIGLLLSALRVHFPGWLGASLSVLGGAAIPVPLVAVGMAIAGAKLHASIREAVWITLVRMVVSPLLAIGVAKLFGLSSLYSIALVISFSLPTAKMAFAVAEKNGIYVEQMASIVTLTTVSLVVIFPAFMWICGRLWPGVMHAVQLSAP